MMRLFAFSFFQVFVTAVSAQFFVENIRASLADLFGIIWSSGDQHLTDFVQLLNLFRFSTPTNMKIHLVTSVVKRPDLATMPSR